jgi:predicted Zn finger-like uncharacterized protein
MKFICPKCKATYALDESLIGPKGTVISCNGCRKRFRVFSARQLEDSRSRGWIVKKMNGATLKVDRLSVLHDWIEQGTISPSDRFSKTGKTWVRIGEIVELSGLFTISQLEKKDRTVKISTIPAEDPRKRAASAKWPASDDNDTAATIPLPIGFGKKLVRQAEHTKAAPAPPGPRQEGDNEPTTVLPIALKRSNLIDEDDSKVLPVPLKGIRSRKGDDTMTFALPLKRKRAPAKDDQKKKK